MVPWTADAPSEQSTVSVKSSAPPNVSLNGTEMTAMVIITSGFNFIIGWRLFIGSGKLGEFHFSKFVSTLSFNSCLFHSTDGTWSNPTQTVTDCQLKTLLDKKTLQKFILLWFLSIIKSSVCTFELTETQDTNVLQETKSLLSVQTFVCFTE